jgi:hypothetical protein
MALITRRSNLQDFADCLDPIGDAVLIDKVLQYLDFSVQLHLGEKAQASFKISLARRISLTSRSSTFIR